MNSANICSPVWSNQLVGVRTEQKVIEELFNCCWDTAAGDATETCKHEQRLASSHQINQSVKLWTVAEMALHLVTVQSQWKTQIGKKISTENLTRVKIVRPSGARMVYRAGLIFAAAAGHHLSQRFVYLVVCPFTPGTCWYSLHGGMSLSVTHRQCHIWKFHTHRHLSPINELMTPVLHFATSDGMHTTFVDISNLCNSARHICDPSIYFNMYTFLLT